MDRNILVDSGTRVGCGTDSYWRCIWIWNTYEQYLYEINGLWNEVIKIIFLVRFPCSFLFIKTEYIPQMRVFRSTRTSLSRPKSLMKKKRKKINQRKKSPLHRICIDTEIKCKFSWAWPRWPWEMSSINWEVDVILCSWGWSCSHCYTQSPLLPI